MTELFDDYLLEEFIHNFYGYGDYNGRHWFIGMEEGGGSSFTEIAGRLTAWVKRGKRELEDVAEYHAEIGATDLFSNRPKLQRTWNKLIRILLSSYGQTPTTEQVREHQRVSWGRLNGDTCLVELLPLPSPSTNHWLYAQHSRLPYLTDRQTYQQACLEQRIAHLRRRITEYQPKAVVFYGFGYKENWQDIAGVEFSLVSDGAYIDRSGSGLFIIAKHPAAKGVTNKYFHQVGKLIPTTPT